MKHLHGLASTYSIASTSPKRQRIHVGTVWVLCENSVNTLWILCGYSVNTMWILRGYSVDTHG